MCHLQKFYGIFLNSFHNVIEPVELIGPANLNGPNSIAIFCSLQAGNAGTFWACGYKLIAGKGLPGEPSSRKVLSREEGLKNGLMAK